MKKNSIKLIFSAIMFLFGTIVKADVLLTPTDLTTETDSAWINIDGWINNPHNKVEVLPSDTGRAKSCIFNININPTSSLAAMIWRTGGVLVDNGWVRILGAGSTKLDRSVFDWNKEKSQLKKDSINYLIIADDVVGGVFALRITNGINIEEASVYYFGANNLMWYPLNINYRKFIQFCFLGNLDRFYADFRWAEWQEEIKSINTMQTISCYPLLWTKEGKDISLNRKIVSVQDCWNNYAKVSNSN
jgi:hypothetical protein